MDQLAVISDVHGNLEALTVVLAKIEEMGIKQIVSLGDTVGYGPDPKICLEMVLEVCETVLMGNHEESVLRGKQTISNPIAQLAIEYTRGQLRGSPLLKAIKALPTYHLDGDCLFVHGSPRRNLHEYLRERDGMGLSTFDAIVKSLDRDFKSFAHCFVGHNHKPFLATTEGFIHPHDLLSDFFVPKEKFYISVGSVGQPRDLNPKACFVTFDGERVHFHRLEYDVETTRDKIVERGLPKFLAHRLVRGK